MAVQFADKALDKWLDNEIKETEAMRGRFFGDNYYKGYVDALKDVKDQLHAFWGSLIDGG